MLAAVTCTGLVPVVTGVWKTAAGLAGPATPIGPTDTIRALTRLPVVCYADTTAVAATSADNDDDSTGVGPC